MNNFFYLPKQVFKKFPYTPSRDFFGSFKGYKHFTIFIVDFLHQFCIKTIIQNLF